MNFTEPCWTIPDHPGDNPEPSGTISNHPQLSWTTLNYSNHAENFAEPCQTILDHPEPSWTFFNHPKSSWTILNHPEPSWTFHNLPEPSWTIPNDAEPSQTMGHILRSVPEPEVPSRKGKEEVGTRHYGGRGGSMVGGEAGWFEGDQTTAVECCESTWRDRVNRGGLKDSNSWSSG